MNWEEIRSEYESTNITLKALAEKYDIKLGTLKSRKSREGWSRDPTDKDATKQPKKDASVKKVATPKKPRYPNGHPGNKNPKNQFTERNQAAVKHGFFSRYIPKETLDIMEEVQEMSPADMIWDQIIIQYTAIIRAQRIMFVEDKNEMIKELKKQKFEIIPSTDGPEQMATELEYEFQFAWERQAQFLNAQSRAMSELRSLIKQFNDMASVDDERRMKLEQMQLSIEKTKVETERIKAETSKIGKGPGKEPLLIEIDYGDDDDE